MVIGSEKTQLNPLPPDSEEIRHKWNSEENESWNIFRQYLRDLIRQSGILLIYNHKHFVVDVVGVLPICHVESPNGVACSAVTLTYRSEFIEYGDCSKCQLIWRGILEELINVICYFTDRISDRALHLYHLRGRNIIESRHF